MMLCKNCWHFFKFRNSWHILTIKLKQTLFQEYSVFIGTAWKLHENNCPGIFHIMLQVNVLFRRGFHGQASLENAECLILSQEWVMRISISDES